MPQLRRVQRRGRTGWSKRVAKYHQYWAVNAAVDSTVEASGPDGDRRGGVVWHTQGSGKSIEMLLLRREDHARSARWSNPTLVFITDRNDLDDQLFGEVFAPGRDPARDARSRPTRRSDLRTLLRPRSPAASSSRRSRSSRPEERAATRNPVLTDRRNVVVMADEAHRSQYGFTRRSTPRAVQSGLAKHLRDALPNATYLGFTGTPIESTDKSTRAVFGDYIDVYDLTRAVEDGATVRIFYESRLAKVELPDEALREPRRRWSTRSPRAPRTTSATSAKTRWARLEAIVGAERAPRPRSPPTSSSTGRAAARRCSARR